MTPTELIAEARELDRKATPGPWVQSGGGYDVCAKGVPAASDPDSRLCVARCMEGSSREYYTAYQTACNDAAFIARSRTLLPALCDDNERLRKELCEAQSTLEQTWEWDMYKAAQKEIERLRKELAAYEDTGLTPEEVNACKHALMGREIAKITEFDGIPLDRLEKICNAEHEGRCVALPCRVGDAVYFADAVHPTATIEEIKLSKGENQYCWVQYEIGPETYELWDEGYFTEDEIGETVFLARAEAEAALKGAENEI